MNKNIKNFLLRGFMFSGLGPIVSGIVFLILHSLNIVEFITPVGMFLSILSTYILAFVVAGASVFYQIEHWSIMKSTMLHGIILYAAYILCYLVNGWIEGNIKSILIFTCIFLLGYVFIWMSIYFSTKAISKKLNAKLASM